VPASVAVSICSHSRRPRLDPSGSGATVSLEHLGLTAEIDEFFVLPSQRGHGVGAELLKADESEILRAGCTNASLQLSRTNDSARAFYHRHGYTERAAYELLDKRLREG
jgi:GNAT superfamily N-acetyltransferase